MSLGSASEFKCNNFIETGQRLQRVVPHTRKNFVKKLDLSLRQLLVALSRSAWGTGPNRPEFLGRARISGQKALRRFSDSPLREMTFFRQVMFSTLYDHNGILEWWVPVALDTCS